MLDRNSATVKSYTEYGLITDFPKIVYSSLYWSEMQSVHQRFPSMIHSYGM